MLLHMTGDACLNGVSLMQTNQLSCRTRQPLKPKSGCIVNAEFTTVSSCQGRTVHAKVPMRSLSSMAVWLSIISCATPRSPIFALEFRPINTATEALFEINVAQHMDQQVCKTGKTDAASNLESMQASFFLLRAYWLP